MSEIREKADLFDGILKNKGISKYSYSLRATEKQELNLENGAFKLMRTVFNNTCTLSVYRGEKMGMVNGNDFTPEALEALADNGIAAAESSPEDPCHDIAPDQGKDVFKQGVYEPDLDKFIERIKELFETIKTDYPKVQVMTATGSFDRIDAIKRNSNGTEFVTEAGFYSIVLEFSAREGEQTTGMDYAYVIAKSLDKPLIELGDFRFRLENIVKALEAKPVEGKFEGTVVLTPSMTGEFIGILIGNYASDRVIIEGTSQWLDKVGEKVADDKLTVSFKPYDERIVIGDRFTGDDFRAEDFTIIDKGVLTNHKLSLYGANKTGRPVIKNDGGDMVVEPGDTALEDIIKGIDKGLLLGGFSGGQPGTNGEFSGVAKNSFVIENGKIARAVTETMVNGNLGDVVKRIKCVSKELVCNGSSVLPYVAVDGIVVSGK
ncbi:MAG: TldD/PmbA family protein [Lachnospiraceae bacterium]|nr:TldD/PmbA family protein [Lachnospiraceae bacterium]MBP5183550.1 TldD/PmbA family protein [Lachnospiraceae bacterium]